MGKRNPPPPPSPLPSSKADLATTFLHNCSQTGGGGGEEVFFLFLNLRFLRLSASLSPPFCKDSSHAHNAYARNNRLQHTLTIFSNLFFFSFSSLTHPHVLFPCIPRVIVKKIPSASLLLCFLLMSSMVLAIFPFARSTGKFEKM